MQTNKSPLPTQEFLVDPQSGIAFTIKEGQIIRIIDIEGGQVSDLVSFAQDNIKERLSSGHTNDYNGKLYLSKGDVLYSNLSNPMFSIIDDQVGKHIMLYAPCSQKMFEKSYGVSEAHPNCLDNLVSNLKIYGIHPSDITLPFNIFMNIEISKQGEISIQSPLSKAGDYIDLRAEMDMIVGVTACSAGACNNFKWTSIGIEIYS